ncbi:MAG: helix-turn-helix domain-containing protein, partial [Pseudorhodoplanes sp.]|nr:helix-turn-helix domain-containing protein [Pseudorhodoplanes sp.]
MAVNRTKKREKAAPASQAVSADDEQFAADVGKLVRRGRAKRGITRRQLAGDSGISERYLAQIESGQGNPSVIVLKAIAEAFEMPAADLLPA